jgi:hypothetical protein
VRYGTVYLPPPLSLPKLILVNFLFQGGQEKGGKFRHEKCIKIVKTYVILTGETFLSLFSITRCHEKKCTVLHMEVKVCIAFLFETKYLV